MTYNFVVDMQAFSSKMWSKVVESGMDVGGRGRK
jgi:hypothetical protein